VVSPLDEQGLDLFEQTASAAGNFPQVLRGYDRSAVDAYVREVEAKHARTLAELREARYQLELTAATTDTTDYAKLGGHARSLLKSAEAQAAEIVQAARAEADALRSHASADTARLSHETTAALDLSRANTTADLEELRRLLGEQTAAELEAARADAAALLESTERQREWLLRESETQARAMIDAATAEAEQRRAETARIAAEQAVELARAKEEALAEIAAGRQAAAEQITELLAATKAEVEAQHARLAEDLTTADQRREAARAEAAQIAQAAAEQAQATIDHAEHEATRIAAESNAAIAAQAAELQREVEALNLRRQGIIGQLEQLSTLAIDTVDQAANEPTTDSDSKEAPGTP